MTLNVTSVAAVENKKEVDRESENGDEVTKKVWLPAWTSGTPVGWVGGMRRRKGEPGGSAVRNGEGTNCGRGR